jgi:hypothetical protein
MQTELHIAGTHLCKALAAIHRPVALRLEGHTGLAAACSTSGSEELTGTTGRILAGITAGFAALGLILEPTLSIKLLLTGGEHEFFSTFLANKGLVFVHFESSLLKISRFGSFICDQLPLFSPEGKLTSFFLMRWTALSTDFTLRPVAAAIS